ncbi:MAG: four helix bundle protein [Planctomycetota bacterium]
MKNVQSYRDLLVWQKSMTFVTEVYAITSKYPVSEQYGLTSQTRRSAVSIPSNIAEGYGRNSTSDYVRFLRVSRGSLYELQTQLEIAMNLKYISKDEFANTLSRSDEISKMMFGLIRSVESYKK